MLPKTLITGVIFGIFAATSAAQALSIREAGKPAEIPPASFTGAQYVDSRGCVYVRAGYDGNVQWVPRVTRAREVICGQTPSMQGGAVSASTAKAPAAPVPTASAPKAVVSLGAVAGLTGFPVPSGYKVAWQDGRLNPQRGLPAGAAN